MATEALEIRGPASGLLDEPFALRVRGAGPDAELTWRARYRDDDGRIWKTAAACIDDLPHGWVAAKESTGAVAALRSLRPLSIELRAEAPDGRAATRTFTRLLAADGVRSRRWRDGLAATLHVPAQAQPCATVILDGTAGETQATVATVAAPLLASRGVVALAVTAARGRAASADALSIARARLAAVPAASHEIVLLLALDPGDENIAGPDAAATDAAGASEADTDAAGAHAARTVVLPPNAGARDAGPASAAARAAAWDALLQQLGAVPRS